MTNAIIPHPLRGNFINGQFLVTSEKPDRILQRSCPADATQLLWESPIVYSHIALVTEAAQRGFRIWKNESDQVRADALIRYQGEIDRRTSELSDALSLETGRPIHESRSEIQALAPYVTESIDGHYHRQSDSGRIHIDRCPIGPVLITMAIPFSLTDLHIAIVQLLMAGNSIIIHPSECALMSTQIIVECLEAANLPSGVVSMIVGPDETLLRLCRENDIRGIVFHGPLETGRKILSLTHTDVSKTVALNLTGKNIAIVHDDAPIESSSKELIDSCFMGAGQYWNSTSLIWVHQSLRSNFIEHFHEMAKSLVIDHPFLHDSQPFMGPLIDEKAVESYLLYMGMAKREGLDEIMRGKHLTRPHKGHYVSPSIHFLDEWKSHSGRFIHSVVPGPNATFISYDHIDDIVEAINRAPHQSAASIFSENEDTIQHVRQTLDVGLLNINVGTIRRHPKLPLVGIRQCGNMRPFSTGLGTQCSFSRSGLRRE